MRLVTLDASHIDAGGIHGDSEEGNVGHSPCYHGGQIAASCVVFHADNVGGAVPKATEKTELKIGTVSHDDLGDLLEEREVVPDQGRVGGSSTPLSGN